MEARIREYEASDKAGCMETFKSNVPLFFTTSEITDFGSFLDRFEQLNFEKTDERVYYYVVEVDGKIVGCGGFGFYNPIENSTLIWGLIHKDYHKLGLGEQLLLHRLQQKAKLYPEKLITIDTTQHSYGFFEKYGFVTTKITLDFYAEGMHRYDMAFKTVNR